MINIELDLALLVLFFNKEIYKKYSIFVDMNSIAEEAKVLLNAYEKYFSEYNKDIDIANFSAWFYNSTVGDTTAYKHILSRLLTVEPPAIESVLDGLRYRKLGLKIIDTLGLKNALADKIVSLKKFDAAKIENIVVSFNKLKSLEEDIYTHELQDIYTADKYEYLPTRLKRLNGIINGWKKDFLHLVVAGTDGGKTAFCCGEAVATARTTTDDKPVLFFTNEQSSKMISQRIGSAFLNQNSIQFTKFKKYVSDNVDKCQQKYNELGGNRIEIINIFGKSLNHIKKYCDKFTPSLIIIDQLDNMLTGKTLDASPRPYNDMYKRVRSEIAQVYAPVIGTTQAKNRGMYQDRDTGKWVYKENIGSSDVHWSNVDKQANVDVLIGIGVLNRDTTLRHITIDRHKEGLLGEFCAILDRNASRYEDI